LLASEHKEMQLLFPLVDASGQLVGVITRGAIRDARKAEKIFDGTKLIEITSGMVEEANPDETLRAVVYRMAESGATRMPVVDRVTRRLLGMVSLEDLLKARARHLEEERRRAKKRANPGFPLFRFLPERRRAQWCGVLITTGKQ